MNAIPEQYIDASKEFRAYMRIQKGEKGQFLSNLMDGAEVHLTRIIQSGIDASFTILYDESLTIEQLVRFYTAIEFHDDWLTAGNGHTAWKSLRYYLSFRSEKEGIDWKPIYNSVKGEFEKQREEAKKREARGLKVSTAQSRKELMEQFRNNQSLEGVRNWSSEITSLLKV